MKSFRIGVGLLILMLMLSGGVFYALAIGKSHQVEASAQSESFTTIDPAILNRYVLVPESTLIQWSKDAIGVVGNIESENVFYVHAGYWKGTRDRPDYRSDPDHPIFIYSVKGEIKSQVFHGAPPSDPNAPTPEPQNPTAATIVFDAVTGAWLSYRGGEFIDDISPQIVDQNHDEYMTRIAIFEASLEPPVTLAPIEGTAEVLPLP